MEIPVRIASILISEKGALTLDEKEFYLETITNFLPLKITRI